MELQNLRDEARDKENEANGHYWQHVTTLDQHALAKGYACEMEAREIRKRIKEIEAVPEPEPVVPEKPVKCYYPPDWEKRRNKSNPSGKCP